MGTTVARSTVPRELGSAADRDVAAEAVRAFAADLVGAVATEPGNLVLSPYSVAVATAMTRNGAHGVTATEMDAVLHAPDLDIYDAGLSALAAHVGGLAGTRQDHDGSTVEIRLDVANSLWGQGGLGWESGFLDAMARSYGTGMRTADYLTDPETARRSINAWTAEHTHDKIPELLIDGSISTDTRLLLVNAIYLKAPWAEPFQTENTRRGEFHRSDGTVVETDLMTSRLYRAAFARGAGWQAVRLPYWGDDLAMTVVLPDEGRAHALDWSALPTPERGPAVELTMPRWRFRHHVGLKETMVGLGMPVAFTPDADFSGMTTDERLWIDEVVHEAYIAVDEEGTEAAAATGVLMVAVSYRPTVQVELTRPFWFCIHDVETLTPLFVGRVDDPTGE